MSVSLGLLRLALPIIFAGCSDANNGGAASDGDSALEEDIDVGEELLDGDAYDTRDTCEPTAGLTAQGVLALEDSDFDYNPVLLDGSVIYGTELGSEFGRYRVISEDVRTGTRRIVAENATLLDAREGKALVLVDDGERRFARLELHDAMRAIEVRNFQEPNSTIWASNYLYNGRSRLIEGDMVAWVEADITTGLTKWSVLTAEHGETRTVWSGAGDPGGPELRSGRLLWVTRLGGMGTVMLATLGKRTIESLGSSEIVMQTALGDDAAWWLEGGKVMRHGFDGETRVMHDGPCNGIVADGRHAAAVCGVEHYVPDYRKPSHGTPLVFDASGSTALETRRMGGGDVLVNGLMLAGSRIAWVEYPLDVSCGNGNASSGGELVLTDVDGASAPTALGPVGTGCWCCDAYWTPLMLALNSDAVAWNYPAGATAPVSKYGRFSSVGWALFAQHCPVDR